MLERAIRTALNGTLPVMLMFVALTAGVFALINTPREEEPQIVVPLADVLIEAPTLDARQVERLVATPLEKLLAQIDGVEHVYSMSDDGRAIVTVRFFVGQDREDSLVKLYNKLLSNQDLVPPGLTSWVVKPVEVDDVPIVVATLWSDRADVDDYDLRRLAQELALDLQTVPDTNRIEVIGGRARELRVDIDPTAMAARNTAISDVLFALTVSNVRLPGGQLQRANTQLIVETDARISDVASLGDLTVNVVDGVPVRIRDIAAVYDGAAEPTSYNWITFGPAHPDRSGGSPYASVDIAIAKKKGANAVVVAQDVLQRLDRISAQLFPAGVHYEITRDYGRTADAKIDDLIESLAIAVLSVVVLIGLFLGWRAALVVALAVPICYGFTLLLDYAAGYTINRVTLFALILALGLLVDDPIAGVDNIERHLAGGRSSADDITRAILEIRMPLVMSTVAIVIAFAPMRFITGMMGPYMSPMAFNVPAAVVFSTVVAFFVTPWLCMRLLRPRPDKGVPASDLYARLVAPMLASRRRSWLFLGALAAAFIVALLLPFLRVVPLKLLPHDNKNEFQVVIDAPEAATLEHTDGAAARIASYLATVPEVRAVVAYSGNHSPMDFNGMVRHYYHRAGSNVAELRITLADKFSRPQQSHALVLRLRDDIARIAKESGVIAKLVEVPPGPPVIASIVGELYGSATTSYATLIEAARATAARLTREPGVVDVDVSAISPAARRVFVPDQEKAALSGVSAEAIATTLEVVIDGRVATYVRAPAEVAPLPIRVQVPYAQRTDLGNVHIKGLPGIAKIRGAGGVTDAPTPLVSLAELGRFVETTREQPIYHKDLKRVAYAFAEVAGRTPAEVIFDVDADRDTDASAREVAARTYFASGGGDAWTLPSDVEISWSGEGEWDITLRVFRDLGIGFAVAILGMFLVIWWQTRRAALTAIILLAIPLTAIGIMPGFVLLNLVVSNQVGAYGDPVLFTATAMIGMIALAGIVVRNSLILIEFIEHERERGTPIDTALLRAGAMRARPVLLTAGTSVLGNLVITLDPIFSGLAWAIIFGVIASTAFTLLVVPVVYRLVYGGAANATHAESP
ncbi:MAG TPA: efflux RND transporter permease subunit [Pseudomonadales bacterium]